MAAQIFYCCQGGDGTTPLVADAAHCWDADDVSTAANWANPKVSGKVGPGDTVYFMSDGGTIVGTGTATIWIKASGDAGNHITLTGDGSAIIDGESVRKALASDGKDYITIDNLEICYGLDNTLNAYAADHWIIEDCEIHHVASSGPNKGTVLSGWGNDWLIRRNTIHDSTEDHLLYCFSETDDTPSTNIIIEYNYFYGSASSGVKFNGTTQYFTGCVVRYNYFYNNPYDIEVCTTDGLEIYGNIIVHDIASMWNGIILGDDTVGHAHQKNTRIWNNVFYGQFQSMIELFGLQDATPAISELYNNIFFHTAGTGGTKNYIWLRTAGSAIAAADKNLYYTTDAATWTVVSTLYDNLEDWKTASGLDANSKEEDPLFTDVGNEIFTLEALSPAKDAGALGGFPAGLNSIVRKSDFGLGNNITLAPYGVTPAMGAYAYGTISPWVMIYG